MIKDLVKKEIMVRIKRAEQQHNVRVLYAIESGSRAWGFESPNSDYDVRFIYAHPKDWYIAVNLEDKRDVIEYEIVDEIDINGWDVRKALQLFAKSNPTFIEWMQSPIVYIDDGVFSKQVKALIPSIYSIEKGIYHYRSMAKTNYRGYLREPVVSLKKYFYVLRPLFSILWLEHNNQPAPIEFDQLRALVNDNQLLTNEIEILLARKKASLEKEIIPAVTVINTFIEQQLERLEQYDAQSGANFKQFDVLNKVFHHVLAE